MEYATNRRSYAAAEDMAAVWDHPETETRLA